MLQFHLQFPQELTVAWVKTVKSPDGAFWPAGQLVVIQKSFESPCHIVVGCYDFLCSQSQMAPKFLEMAICWLTTMT